MTERLIARREDGVGTWFSTIPRSATPCRPNVAGGRVRARRLRGRPRSPRGGVRRRGRKAFVSGADISSSRASARAERRSRAIARRAPDRHMLEAPSEAYDRPDHGRLRRWWLAVALSCDLRSRGDSRFAIPAAQLGLGYGFDGLAPGPPEGRRSRRRCFHRAPAQRGRSLELWPGQSRGPGRELAGVRADAALAITDNRRSPPREQAAIIGEALKDPTARDLDRLAARSLPASRAPTTPRAAARFSRSARPGSAAPEPQARKAL